MVSKSLIKLIDEAIIPAALLVVAKLASLLAVAYLLNLHFNLAGSKIFNILPTVTFTNLTDYELAETYSNLGMFVTAAAGTMYVLVKAHFFHESHIHPNFQLKLIKLRLENIITPSYHLYHQAAIWLVFLWLTVAFLIISTLLGVTNAYVTIIAFIIAANFSWVFTLDIEKEVEIQKES